MEFCQKEDGQDRKTNKKLGVSEGLKTHYSNTRANVPQLNLVKVLTLYSFPEIVGELDSNDLLFKTLQFVMPLNYATCVYCQQKHLTCS